MGLFLLVANAARLLQERWWDISGISGPLTDRQSPRRQLPTWPGVGKPGALWSSWASSTWNPGEHGEDTEAQALS